MEPDRDGTVMMAVKCEIDLNTGYTSKISDVLLIQVVLFVIDVGGR